MEIINLNTRRKYSLSEMLDRLQKDTTLSFMSHGYLYFRKNNKILRTEIKKDTDYLRESKEVILDDKIITQTYFLTDYVVSNHIRKIKISDVKKYLMSGDHLLLALEKYWLSFQLNEDTIEMICVDSQLNKLDISEEELDKILADNFLSSFINGYWYIVNDEDE